MPADTIFALSSGQLPAGVAVMRISGPEALTVASSMMSGLPEPRRAVLRILAGKDGAFLDQALVLVFPGPNSFTGEDCVELHLHGSRAVVAGVSAALRMHAGVRQAEPGEFSRRAFENGRLDLVEAEGLAELISAETEMQRRLAVEQGFGGQSALYEGWAQRLTYLRAMIEAELDFADEEDVPDSLAEGLGDEIRQLHGELMRHLQSAKAGEIIRDGYKVVIVGRPNSGKSSLINYLATREVAIVTDIAGTTRDILQVDVDMDGYLVRIFDTAGLRETEDEVEREGVRRARQTMQEADLILLLEEIDSEPQRLELPAGTDMLRIGTKADLHAASDQYDVCISTRTHDGMDRLRKLIAGKVGTVWSGSVAPGRQRQTDLLIRTSHAIENALNAGPLELRAEHLRAAAHCLGRITGRVDVEQLLDVIFSQFCIGK